MIPDFDICSHTLEGWLRRSYEQCVSAVTHLLDGRSDHLHLVGMADGLIPALIAAARRQRSAEPHDAVRLDDSDWYMALHDALHPLLGRPSIPVVIMQELHRTALWADEHVAYAIRELVETGRARLLTSAYRLPCPGRVSEAGAFEILRTAETNYVLPLDLAATTDLASTLWRDASLDPSSEHFEYVHRWSGGSVSLAASCCRALAERGALTDPSTMEGSGRERSLLASSASTLESMWRPLSEDERSFLTASAGEVHSSATDHPDPGLIQRLASLGMIVPEDGAHRLFSSAFDAYVATKRTPDAALSQLMASLQPIQRRLYLALLSDANRVVPRRALIEAAWGDAEAVRAGYLDQQISRLRKALAACDPMAKLLGAVPEAVRGSGYRLILHSQDVLRELTESAEVWRRGL
jgi:DNA-binding winged helix-turn-helix (wHTH) protein